MARQLDLTKTASKEDTKTSAEQQIPDEQQKEQQAKEEEEQKLKSAGLTRESYEVEVTADGTTPQGALYISIINTGKDEATVNGKTLKTGEEKTYPFVGKGYREIPYITAGTTLRILCIL